MAKKVSKQDIGGARRRAMSDVGGKASGKAESKGALGGGRKRSVSVLGSGDNRRMSFGGKVGPRRAGGLESKRVVLKAVDKGGEVPEVSASAIKELTKAADELGASMEGMVEAIGEDFKAAASGGKLGVVVSSGSTLSDSLDTALTAIDILGSSAPGMGMLGGLKGVVTEVIKGGCREEVLGEAFFKDVMQLFEDGRLSGANGVMDTFEVDLSSPEAFAESIGVHGRLSEGEFVKILCEIAGEDESVIQDLLNEIKSREGGEETLSKLKGFMETARTALSVIGACAKAGGKGALYAARALLALVLAVTVLPAMVILQNVLSLTVGVFLALPSAAVFGGANDSNITKGLLGVAMAGTFGGYFTLLSIAKLLGVKTKATSDGNLENPLGEMMMLSNLAVVAAIAMEKDLAVTQFLQDGTRTRDGRR